MTEKEIIDSLIEIRKAKNITQKHINDTSELTQQQVSSLERMERSPKLTTLLKYCEAIGVKLSISDGDVVKEFDIRNKEYRISEIVEALKELQKK